MASPSAASTVPMENLELEDRSTATGDNSGRSMVENGALPVEPEQLPKDSSQFLSTSEKVLTANADASNQSDNSDITTKEEKDITDQSEVTVDDEETNDAEGTAKAVELTATESYNETIRQLPPPPEGGWGWVVVSAGFLTCALAGGSDWAWGVYQRYYTSEGIFPGATNKNVAMVGSVSGGVFGIVGLFAGRLADTWGPRNVVIVGATLYVTGLVLASFCTELWMLFLTQGLIKGIGGGMFYMPPLALVPQYFARRRGLATGLMVSGVGLGGFALSSGTQAMLDKFGHQWALRITAIVSAVCLTYVAFAMRSRFPRLRGAPLLDFSKLKSKRFWLAAMTLFFIQLGFFSLTYFTPAWSVYNGLTQNQGANLVAFLNLFSFTGRIFQGFTADFAGVANVFVLCVLIAALCDLVYWPFSTTWASQMGLVFLYGFFGGGYASTLPVVMVLAFGVEQIGTTLGMVYVFFVPGGLCGPIIAGALIDGGTTTLPDGTTHINFLPAMLWGGLNLLMGAVFALWLRYDLSKGKTFIRI